MRDFDVAMQDATIAIQDKGRLTAGSLEWLNETAGTDFPITKTLFTDNPRREMTDSLTGITVVGFSNGDTMKAVCCGLADLAICGSDKFAEYDNIGRDYEPFEPALVRALGFAQCRLVFARPDGANGLVKRVVTSYPRQAQAYLYRGGWRDTVDENLMLAVFAGGIEMIGRRNGCDIVDIVQTGESLTGNGYEEVETISNCEAILVKAERTTDTSTYEWYSQGGSEDKIGTGLRDTGNDTFRARPYRYTLLDGRRW